MSSLLEGIGDTPLIELPSLRPEDGARIFAKWEGENPTGSMKDRMALSVIENAEREGRLSPGQRIVELTGGSTGSSLALVGGIKGYPTSLVTADCFADEKIKTMAALGADVEVFKTPDGSVYPGLIDDLEKRVDEIKEATDAYYTDQFNNPHVTQGYLEFGGEIVNDCPEVTDFVMAVGTAGCAMGTARVLRDGVPEARITLVEPDECATLSRGETGSHEVEGIALGFKPPLLEDSLYDDVLAIPESDGRRFARQAAAEEGLFVGVSSGLNLAAAKQVAENRPPDDIVVTVAVDTGLKYLQGDLYNVLD